MDDSFMYDLGIRLYVLYEYRQTCKYGTNAKSAFKAMNNTHNKLLQTAFKEAQPSDSICIMG